MKDKDIRERTGNQASGEPKNIVDWVTHESQKLGYNFKILSNTQQQRIITAIMSGLENGFRSRCNYPDLRFARRRGIGGYFSSEGNNPKEDSDSKLIKDNDCDKTKSIDMVDCGDGIECTDFSCMLMSQGCGLSDTGCSENDGFTCDNGCVNETTETCTDSGKCIDNECENSGSNTQSCTDSASGNFSCTDSSCTNTAGAGCIDSDNCLDDSGCFNNSQFSNCIDKGNCSDMACKNQNQYGRQCVDEATCTDLRCCNRICKDDTACEDSKGCANCRDCSDLGNLTSTCIDNGCIDTGIQVGCTDAKCKDQKCFNIGDKCVDTTENCTDSPCANMTTCSNSDCPFHADEGKCTNQPYCPKLESNDCGQDFSCDGAFPCLDKSGMCPVDLQNDTNACIDTGGCKDSSCEDGNNCIDYGPLGSTCVDGGGLGNCKNEATAQCIDFENCTDSLCEDHGMCIDLKDCTDQIGGCQDIDVCVDVGSNCKQGQDEQSGCTLSDEVNMSGCKTEVFLRDRKATDTQGSSCNDPTDSPPTCDPFDSASSGCPVCDTSTSCPYADNVLTECVDNSCDPP